ncbi:stalk domain-containing protein [Saccharibacillus sacchari]|uniref:Stalk domain-containing protein n=1 Tax=Saccharibacillus sacchari TaxID=456493 RepID=A0ACC6P9X8_9BACL
MKLAKKGMVLLFALLLAIGMAVPALAAEQTTLALQVRIGSTSALINGEKQTIEKPYVQNGMTMVPLGVFQRAFGTTSRLEGDDTVRLSQGAHTVTFKIGSKTAWVNGKKTTLAAAPVMKNGTLMVPMRPVTDMLKATVKFSSGTLTVTLISDTGVPGQNSSENEAEAPATARVGSSYANWSIDYPADTVAQPGDDEFSAMIGDLDGSYVLQIYVWEEDQNVSVTDMLEQLEQESLSSGETLIDRQTFPNAVMPYAQVIARDADGIYWESRRYYDKGKVFSLYMGDSLIEDYREFDQWTDLLNSFRPSFDTQGIKTEDLSKAKNGFADAASYDYGVNLKVPATWTPTGSGQLEYSAKDGSFLSLHAVSVEGSGADSLANWHDFMQKQTNEVFLPEAAKPMTTEPVKASGQDALIESLVYDLGGGNYYWNWLVLENEGYFYVLRYSAPEGAYNKQTFLKIVQSLEIDFDVVPSGFGKLGQISYLKNKKLDVTQSTPDFLFTVPAYWSTQASDSAQLDMRYFIPGGSLRVSNVETGLEASAAQAVRNYAELKLDDPTLTYEAPKRTTIAGVPAIRITYTGTGTNGNPYQAEDIYFRHQDKTYWIHHQLDRGTATPEQLNGIERTLQSFKFLPVK